MGQHALFISQIPKKALKRGSRLSCHKLKNQSVPIAKVLRWYTATFQVISPLVIEELYSVGGRKRQLASTLVQSQMVEAPGIRPPQKTAAARALHIKNPPTHKAWH